MRAPHRTDSLALTLCMPDVAWCGLDGSTRTLVNVRPSPRSACSPRGTCQRTPPFRLPTATPQFLLFLLLSILEISQI